MWICTPCERVFNGIQQYQDHLNSIRHRDKVEQKENTQIKSIQNSSSLSDLDEYLIPYNSGFRCIACETYLNSPQQAEQHKRGEKHKKMKSKTSNRNQNYSNASAQTTNNADFNDCQVDYVQNILPNVSLSDLDEVIVPFNLGFKCIPCEKYLNSPHQVEQHKNSEKHKKMVNKSGFRDKISFESSNSTIAPDSPTKFDKENSLVNEFHFRDINISDVLRGIKTFNVDEPISFEK